MVNNILIIGITGNGKSALANLLANTDKFGESSFSVSETKNFEKSDIFEWQGKQYQVIDNIGFGDSTHISKEDILLKIGEGIHSAEEGINQVLFVFGGRFAPEQVEAFNTFKKFVSESRVTEFTTLVRTKFSKFRDEKACEKDKVSLLSEENKDLREIIKSCNGFIHIDNQKVPEVNEDDSDNEMEIEKATEKRGKSREKVLNYLVENCQKNYKLKGWDSIYSLVANYIDKKKEIEQDDSLKKEKELEKIKEEVTKQIKISLLDKGKLTAVIEQNEQ
ncbi:MAG: hypothetical protein MRERV_20c045 [Mycoplasmataceae bacterium RV_VA103A]|nr:MAG: hypothetical protein MRERV_20c045 [Mycoplasmataceae bacterium RV_VA103A]